MNERLTPNEYGTCAVKRFYSLRAKIQVFVFWEFFRMSAEDCGTQGMGGPLDLYIRTSQPSLITRYQGE